MTARKKGPIAPDHHVSVSQFKLFYACPRKYWYKYPMGIPTPTTSSLALGTATHNVLERYLTMPDWQFDWEEDKAHKTAAPGIQFLPKPGTVNVETKISVLIAGLELVGAVDWYSVDGTTLDIGDHKTSKDPGKWAKTEQQLKTDLQMNVYAAALQRQLAIKADKLVLRHVTYRTVGVPYALPTTVMGDLKYAEMTWYKLEKTVPRIIALRKETNSNNVPTVQVTCGAYGGCPYQRICDGSPKFRQNKQLAKLLSSAATPQAIVAKMRGSNMSSASEVKARLLAKLNLVGNTAVPTAAPKPAAPAQQPPKPVVAAATAGYTPAVLIDPAELLKTIDAFGGSLALNAVIPFVEKRYSVTWKGEAHATDSLRASGLQVIADTAGVMQVSARAPEPAAVPVAVVATPTPTPEPAAKKPKATKAAKPTGANQQLLDTLVNAVALANGRLPMDQGFTACKEVWPGARFHNSRFNKVLEMAVNLNLLTHDEDYITAAATAPAVVVDTPAVALPAAPTPAAEATPVSVQPEPAAAPSTPAVDPERYAHQEGTPVNTPVGLDCTILLGCVGHHSVTGPTGAVSLDHWLAPAAATVEKRDGMHWITDEYGKGRKALASQVLADLRSGTMKLPAILYVPKQHPAWSELSVIFAALPILVIRPC